MGVNQPVSNLCLPQWGDTSFSLASLSPQLTQTRVNSRMGLWVPPW